MDNRDFHRAALDSIRAIPNYKSLSFLELGCGDGFILEALHQDGVTARGTTYRSREKDYIRTRDYPQHLEVDYDINLNRPLPYPDGSVDVVYSTEVIEHVEGHRNFITEAARVLRAGGWLILTTPNLHRILSRLNFALSGVHLTKQALIPWNEPLQRMEEFHHRCVDFPLLHWLMWQNGLRVEGMAATEVKAVSRLALVFRPILARFTAHHVRRHMTDDLVDRDARADLLRWMNDPVLLSSEQLCVIARKRR